MIFLTQKEADEIIYTSNFLVSNLTLVLIVNQIFFGLVCFRFSGKINIIFVGSLFKVKVLLKHIFSVLIQFMKQYFLIRTFHFGFYGILKMFLLVPVVVKQYMLKKLSFLCQYGSVLFKGNIFVFPPSEVSRLQTITLKRRTIV